MRRAAKGLAFAAGLALMGSASAGYVDLTEPGAGSTNDYVAGPPGAHALYESLATSIVGTGYIDPFLRINPGGGITPEMGWNNDFRKKNQQFYEDASWTRRILLSEIPTVRIGGIDYREFLLDINQANNKAGAQYLSLDVVRIWFGADSPAAKSYVDGKTGFDNSGYFNAYTGKLAYSLDSTEDNQVLLDYTVCEGNPACFGAKGSGNNFDMRLLVPDSAFTGANPTDYVTLFSAFGWLDTYSEKCRDTADLEQCTWAQTDGFEEWALRAGVRPPGEGGGVPEPGTLALLGLAGLAASRRRKK